MTAPLVAVAAVLRDWLSNYGIHIEAHLGAVGDIEAMNMLECPPRWADEICESLRCRDPMAAEAMAALIEKTRKSRDSIGSRVDLLIQGLPLGVGEPWFDGIEPAMARAMMAIPAARGVEFGHGFAVQHLKGSEHNSPGAEHQNNRCLKENSLMARLQGFQQAHRWTFAWRSNHHRASLENNRR